MQVGIVALLVRHLGLVLATAEVAAAAETAAAAVATRDHPAEDGQSLAPSTGEDEVGVDILLPERVRRVQTNGAIPIVYPTLRVVYEHFVSMVDFLKLFCSFLIPLIFVWMKPQG